MENAPPSVDGRAVAQAKSGVRGNIKSVGQVLGGHAAPDRAEFLKRLPETMIKNGNVVSVRAEIGGMIPGASNPTGTGSGIKLCRGTSSSNGSSTVVTLDTAAGRWVAELAAQNHGGDILASPKMKSAGEAQNVERVLTTLQIKSSAGALHKGQFWGDQTIGEVEDALKPHVDCGGGAFSFVLRTAFPNKVYSERAQTLEQAGLIPNAVMMLRPKSDSGANGVGDNVRQTNAGLEAPIDGGAYHIEKSWAQ
eukprot:SAG11_NODE_657_length_7898_cov_13.699320_9_plen_251_part_00